MESFHGIELVKVVRFALGLPGLRWRTITMSKDKTYRLVCKVLHVSFLVARLVNEIWQLCSTAFNYPPSWQKRHGLS